MKKLIALLLALVMVLGLAACGETAAPETTPAAGGETKRALRVLSPRKRVLHWRI